MQNFKISGRKSTLQDFQNSQQIRNFKSWCQNQKFPTFSANFFGLFEPFCASFEGQHLKVISKSAKEWMKFHEIFFRARNILKSSKINFEHLMIIRTTQTKYIFST